MNILLLNWRDPKHPLAGGAEIMLLEHAKYWKKKGASITWIASSFPGAKKDEMIEGIRVQRIGSQYTVHLSVAMQRLMGNFSSYDVVVDCFHFIPFFSPIFFRKKKVIAVIHEIAGSVWFDNSIFPIALIGYLLEPFFFIFYMATPFITVSASTVKELKKIHVPLEHIHLIHNGITRIVHKRHVPKSKDPMILFLNRLSRDKGIEDTLVAYQKIVKKIPSVILSIAGKEEKPGSFATLLQRYNCDKSDIRYEGFVSEEKKWELLEKAWILLHPSRKEGWGLTVLEANSVGSPVIGYNVEGLRDSIVDGKTGVLVNKNSDALASAVVNILSKHQLRKTLSTNAKKWSKNFIWDKAGAKSWELLRHYERK